MNCNNTVSTGFQQLDEVLGGGFHGGSLNLIASRPGMGKTTFVLQCAAGMAKNTDKMIYIFSLEMSSECIKKRFKGLCNQSNIMIDDTALITPSQARAKLAGISDLGAVIIDYFQLLQSDDSACEQTAAIRASKIAGELKMISLELGVPVICSAQAPRMADKESYRPHLRDLRFTGCIEEDADVLLFLHRDVDYNAEERADCPAVEIIPAKNRYGGLETFPLCYEEPQIHEMNSLISICTP